MADLPHNCIPAVPANIVEQRLRALDFGDKRRAGSVLKDAPGEEHHQLIAPDYSPLLVDNTDPIRITVECDCEIGVVFSNGGYRVLHILDDRRIRVVVREAAVGLAKQLDDFAAQIPVKRRCNEAAHSISRIDNDLQLLRTDFDVTRDMGLVSVHYVEGGALPFTAGELSTGRVRLYFPDGLSEDGALAEAYLETIVVGRIVAPGYHYAPTDIEFEEAEIERWGWNHADVNYIRAGCVQASQNEIAKARRALARITTDGYFPDTPAPVEGPDRAGQVVDDFIGKVPIDDSPDVIFPKDMMVELHGRNSMREIVKREDGGREG
jgi:hypothetical protein